MNAHVDRNLFVCLACGLAGFGVLMVQSASITSWPTEFEQVYLSRHLVFLLLGLASGTVAALLPPRFWFRAAPALFIVTLVLLAAVLVPGIGTEVNGARRWLRAGSVSLQPSELAKIALPLLLARIVTVRREKLRGWIGGTVPLLFPVALVVPLVFLEPDMGTSLFLVAGAAVLLFVGGWPLRNFLLGAALVPPASLSLLALKPYQWRRITGFLETWRDWSQAPYQVKQGLLTLGAGGTTGVGLGKGVQKLSFLPEANTDFVFAVVGEELGLVGTLGLVGMWAGLYVAGLRLLRPLDRAGFCYVAAFTLLTQVVMQAALNVAVVTAMVPPKGIPHPLLSYGGSNLVCTLTALGIVCGLARGEDAGFGIDVSSRRP